MKKKTREFIRSIERTVEVLQSIPPCGSMQEPERTVIDNLWTVRDRFVNQMMGELPEYQIPPTASLFVQAFHWPDCEGACILPDGRLLTFWDEYTWVDIMTETEYLHYIAIRTADSRSEEELAPVKEFCRKRLAKTPA